MKPTDVAPLYHGTSESLAKRIVSQGLIPGRTLPTADPRYVYLTSNNVEALLIFGYARTVYDMTKVRPRPNGMKKTEFKRWSEVESKKMNFKPVVSDRIALIEIDALRLDPRLLQNGNLVDEIIHLGPISTKAIVRVCYFNVTLSIFECATAYAQDRKALRKFVGTSFQPDEVLGLEQVEA